MVIGRLFNLVSTGMVSWITEFHLSESWGGLKLARFFYVIKIRDKVYDFIEVFIIQSIFRNSVYLIKRLVSLQLETKVALVIKTHLSYVPQPI